jgi:hypothetical protein
MGVLCYSRESRRIILRGFRVRAGSGVAASAHELDTIDAVLDQGTDPTPQVVDRVALDPIPPEMPSGAGKDWS